MQDRLASYTPLERRSYCCLPGEGVSEAREGSMRSRRPAGRESRLTRCRSMPDPPSAYRSTSARAADPAIAIRVRVPRAPPDPSGSSRRSLSDGLAMSLVDWPQTVCQSTGLPPARPCCAYSLFDPLVAECQTRDGDRSAGFVANGERDGSVAGFRHFVAGDIAEDAGDFHGDGFFRDQFLAFFV